MTEEQFRRLALALPEATESEHQGHPDFRVAGKVFATLGPDGDWGMVKLPPEHQATLVRDAPAVFEPFNGAWGRQGCTRVDLARAGEDTVREALIAAWRRTAPRSLVRQHDEGSA